MTPRLSRSHWTAAPVTASDPSTAWTPRPAAARRPGGAGPSIECAVAGGTDPREAGGGDAQVAQDLVVPAERTQVEQHRPRGMRVIRDMSPAGGTAGEPPDEQGVDRSEEDVPPLGVCAAARGGI